MKNNLKEVKTYHDNGILHEHYFVNELNEIDGEYKKWYKNGQQWEIGYYKNGLVEGEYKVWYENGHQWKISHYKDGLLEGERNVMFCWDNNIKVNSFLLNYIYYYKREKLFGITLDFFHINI
jgi:antitoxin component YwqK of YwqJK toxin-antitoxin module